MKILLLAKNSIMSEISIIQAPIEQEMATFRAYFRNFLKSDTKLLNLLLFYLIKQKGKQIRPMLVFLTAKMLGEVSNSTYHAAALIELMHTASLVHDDVVDEANKRRGFFTINAIWKNKIAVLVGDYLLAHGLLLATNKQEYQLLGIVSDAVADMSSGELLQLEKSRHLNIDEPTYYEVIRRKTAALMVACTRAGATSAGASAEIIEQMCEVGKNMGIAFQIRDDLFDYETSENTGKPTGNDLKENKITLPLIYALQHAPKTESRKIIGIMRKREKTDEAMKDVMDFVARQGGINYARQTMSDYIDRTKKLLLQMPDNESRLSMLRLIDYTISRKK